MIVVDAHEDIAYNAICYGRDYRINAWEKRRREAGTEVAQQAGDATTGLPDAILGRVGVVFATIFVAPAKPQPTPWDKLEYQTPRQAERLALQQLDHYRRLADECDKIQIIETQAQLDEVLATWEPDKELVEHKQGLVLLMESADPILEPKQFEEWYERGVRIVGPAWAGTRYSGGTGQPGPLTNLGRELLEQMEDLNAILDLSHMAEAAFLESLDRYGGQIIASHSNPRHFVNTDRHLSDEMIRRLAERDGVMGIVLFNRFLKQGWTKFDGKKAVSFSVPLDAIDYVCQLTGSAAHVAIGSDFDGGFGAESIPDGIETVTDLWHIGEALKARGYSEDDVAAIMSGNMLRKLRQSLP
ncbi:MAG TPA: membrane dipeptidase [Oceanobacillus sp.]|nr:membrane dipeptidase [Oceanobacillus sp.]